MDDFNERAKQALINGMMIGAHLLSGIVKNKDLTGEQKYQSCMMLYMFCMEMLNKVIEDMNRLTDEIKDDHMGCSCGSVEMDDILVDEDYKDNDIDR